VRWGVSAAQATVKSDVAGGGEKSIGRNQSKYGYIFVMGVLVRYLTGW